MRLFSVMRSIAAALTSAAIHVGLLALPSGSLSIISSQTTAPRSEALRINLRHLPAKSIISHAPQRTTLAALESPYLPSEQATEPAAKDLSPITSHVVGVPVPYYYSPLEVSERASPTREIDLEPPELRGISGQGKLILVLWINEAGKVDRVETETSQVVSAMEGILAEQFHQTTFAPARLDGKPVKSRMKIEVVVRPPSAYLVPPPRLRTMPASAAGN